MISVLNKDNSKWQLIYNESVILLDKANALSFKFPVDKAQLTVEFIFSDGGEKLKADTIISEEGTKVTLTLFQWNTSDPISSIEVTGPLKLNMANGRKVWIKFRTQTNEKTEHRNFHLSVWGEEVVS